MDRRREAYVLRLMTVLLGVAMGITVLDLRRLGISGEGSVSTAEWLLRIAFWFGPFVILMVYSNGVVRALGQPATVWRTRIMLWAFVAVVFADRPGFATFDAAVFLAATALPAWYVTRVGWHRFLWVAGVTTGLLSLANLVATLEGFPESVTDLDSGANRLQGVLTHPNQVGQISAIGLLCAWHLWAQGRRRSAASLAAVSAITLVWSQSRTSIAALLIAFGWIALHRSSRSMRAVGFILGVACVLGVMYAGTDAVAPQLSRTGSATELVTLTGRTQLWPTIIRIASDQALTGYGLGNERIADASASGAVPWDAESAHSEWLNTFLAFGLPGVGLWVTMWVSYARRRGRHPDVVRDAFVVFAFVLGLTEVASGPVFPSFVYYALVGSLAAVHVPRIGSAPPQPATVVPLGVVADQPKSRAVRT